MVVGGCLSALVLALAVASGPGRGKGPLYTNADLERTRPPGHGSSGASEGAAGDAPALAPPEQRRRDGAKRNAAERADSGSPGRGEEYWRRESERVRDRVRPWRESADDLRTRIEDRQRQPGVRPYSDPQVVSLQRRLAALELRIRDAGDRFEERARRAGALPGWLR